MMVACGPLLKPIMDRVIATPFRSQQKPSTDNSGQRRGDGTSSARQKARRWPEFSLLSTGRPGFSRMSESDQHLPIELNSVGTHEAHVSLSVNFPTEDDPVGGSNDGILITRQTIVAGSTL